MTKEQAKHASAVMLGWVDGKNIQYKRKKENAWIDIEQAPKRTTFYWGWYEFDYRVKPEPKLRPWTEDEVPLGAQLRYKGDTSRSLLGITATDEIRKEWLAEREYSIDGGKTWLPCGVEETKQ